ncbi:MAG: hypothetical protein ACXVDB_03480, partial [Tumebacillaceae bacterium]
NQQDSTKMLQNHVDHAISIISRKILPDPGIASLCCFKGRFPLISPDFPGKNRLIFPSKQEMRTNLREIRTYVCISFPPYGIISSIMKLRTYIPCVVLVL